MSLVSPIANAIASLLEGAAFSGYVDTVAVGQTWQDAATHKVKRALVRPLAPDLPPDGRLRLDTEAQVTCSYEVVWEYSAQGDLTDAMLAMSDAMIATFGDGGPALYGEMSASDVTGGALRVEMGPAFAENQPDPAFAAVDMPNNLTIRWPLTVRAWATL